MVSPRPRVVTRYIALCLMLSVLVGLPASQASAADVLARVGDREVRLEDLSALLETLGPAERAMVRENPAVMARLVRSHLLRQVVLREARAAKFDERSEVRVELARARDEALIDLYLRSVARVPDDFPSEAELQAAYEANKSAFLEPRQYHLAQIFIEKPQGDAAAEREARDRLDQARKTLNAGGGDFAAVARAYSDNEAEAEKGGDVGWLYASQIVPQIRDIASGLAEGAVSEPVLLDGGWHIIKLLDTEPAGTRPLAEVKEPLSDRLRQERALVSREAYLSELLRRNPIVIDAAALSELIAMTGK